HGKEDYEVGQEKDLKQISPVNLKGEFTEEAGKYQGNYVKDADEEIMEDLQKTDALLYSGKINHEYPKCWRCDTPLLQVSIPQWFFGATQFRDKLLSENNEVNWVPDWAGEKFGEWLQQLGDWPVSRQRYWGIPLPIWECNDCDNTKVIGNRDQLPEVPDDLHRPYIDNIRLECGECGGEMERIPDVLDVWFDSGVAPWASLKHPKTDFTFEEEGPVDLEEEGFDQIRGWWNSQFITSIMTYDHKPFRNVVYHGKVKLEGKEMSKSKGIIVKPEEVIEKYGRDLLRYYILTKDVSEDWSWEWDEVEEAESFMNLLENTYNYKETYTNSTEKPGSLNKEDKWILSRFNSMVKKVEKFSTEPNFQAFKAVEEIEDFAANDLSRGYIKMIRDRLKAEDGESKQAAEYTLRKVTNKLLKVLAPFTPYFAEHHWNGDSSVHLEDYPEADNNMIDEDLERNMEIFQDIEEAVARLRQKKGIKLRHPVKKITVSGNQEVKETVNELEELLKDRLNSKKVEYEEVELDYTVKLDYSKAGPELGDKVSEVEKELKEENHQELADKIEKGDSIRIAGEMLSPELFDIRTHVPEGMEGEEFSQGTVYLNEERDEELIKESYVSEVIREIQQTRKDEGLDVNDKVKLALSGDTQPLEDRLDQLKDRINVSKVEIGKKDFKYEGEVEFEGRKLLFTFSKPVE
ncbi:MAG: class I tRNA ligase family protein, partial [Candidatus Nanohaloarchaea archaeon]